jgi:hypothetical protein
MHETNNLKIKKVNYEQIFRIFKAKFCIQVAESSSVSLCRRHPR